MILRELVRIFSAPDALVTTAWLSSELRTFAGVRLHLRKPRVRKSRPEEETFLSIISKRPFTHIIIFRTYFRIRWKPMSNPKRNIFSVSDKPPPHRGLHFPGFSNGFFIYSVLIHVQNVNRFDTSRVKSRMLLPLTRPNRIKNR